jgi:hypothetical protein
MATLKVFADGMSAYATITLRYGEAHDFTGFITTF